MDYKEALKRIKALEADDAAELASAIEGEVDRLNSKNYTVIGEKRDATTKAQSMQTALEAIAKALGIEGDIDAILGDTQGKVSELVSEAKQLRTDKTTLETRATDAEGKVKGFERKSKLSEIATKAGANAAVLEKLFGDKVDEFAIADDGTVKLGDKSLKEHVEGDDALKAFAPALFPSQDTTDKPKDKPKTTLPAGGPSGGNGKPDLVSSYFSKAYTGIKQFAPKSS